MATMPMSITDQEMLRADDHQDGTPREENEEIQAQEMDSALRDNNEERHTPEMDNALQADNEEMQSQETNNASLDAMLNDCRVEMVPLDAIYVEGDQQDDDLVKALAHSIGLIGLQNPICIVANDIEGHAVPYRLVSGRKRYAAFLKLKLPTIPAHILSYAETDSEKEVRKALATTEENLVRKHYSLIELCELVGKAKEMYERIHPDAMQGKAPKRRKDSTVESFQPVSYLTLAAQQLGKSRATVWKYVSIYSKLIQGHPEAFAALQHCDHPILSKLQVLHALAKSPDLEILTRLLCGLGMTPDDKKSKPCTLQEAQKCLEQHRKDAATQIAEAAHTTKETEDQSPLQELSGHFCPEVQAMIEAVPALKNNVTDLQDFASFDEECQRAILFDMDVHRYTYDDSAACWKRFASSTVEDIYADFSPDIQAEIDTLPALRQSKRDLFELAMWGEDDQRLILRHMRDKGMTYAEAECMVGHDDYDDDEDDAEDDEETPAAEHATREITRDIAEQIRKVYEAFSPAVQAEIDALPALKHNLTALEELARYRDEGQREVVQRMRSQHIPFDVAVHQYEHSQDGDEATNPDPRAPEHVNAHVTNKEDVSPAVQPEPHQEQDETFDLAEVVTLFVEQIDTYLRDQRVFQRCGVKIRQDRNTKGRTRILVSIQEGL